MKGIVSALALAVFASSVQAQVGHLPQNSPYRDLETSQELTFFGGHYTPGKDPIGIAPQDGAMFGLRYLIHVGGPAFLMARWSHVNSTRMAIDPTKIGSARQLGQKGVSVNLYDVDLALNLTGQKSFHHIVPVMNIGAGIASCGCTVPNDPYTFGTPFAFTYGAGLRWVPGGRFQLTADWNHYLYQLKYPTDYYLAPTGGTPAVSSSQARSFWKGNRALTIGASLLFFR
ncbi:MAG TPA: hypothetical protein VFP26_13270 [Gemmatimonadaceae bacterium]|nr:hypothetical protein [Gemmatimonadaceae bacterium]